MKIGKILNNYCYICNAYYMLISKSLTHTHIQMRRYLQVIILACAFLLPTIVLAQQANKAFTVVLDAGHGGKDPGAIDSKRSNREKDINLAITLEIGRLLEQYHPEIKVVYTRKTDVFVELGRRAEIANDAKADLFVSVHTNALPKTARKAAGVQTYTLTLRNDVAKTNFSVETRENSVISLEGEAAKKYNYENTPESIIMFELLQDKHMKESVNFGKIVQNSMVANAGRNNKGVYQANLAVLRLTYMPSVLLEVGYISTPSEEDFLMSNSGRNKMAQSIYSAIVKYKGTKK